MLYKYARITGHCIVTGTNGAPMEVLKDKIGRLAGKAGDATILEIDGRKMQIPDSMLEVIDFKRRR